MLRTLAIGAIMAVIVTVQVVVLAFMVRLTRHQRNR